MHPVLRITDFRMKRIAHRVCTKESHRKKDVDWKYQSQILTRPFAATTVWRWTKAERKLQVKVCCITDPWGSVMWTSSCKVINSLFDSWSGHKPGLQVPSPVGAYNPSMFLSHINVSLPRSKNKVFKKFFNVHSKLQCSCLRSYIHHTGATSTFSGPLVWR